MKAPRIIFSENFIFLASKGSSFVVSWKRSQAKSSVSSLTEKSWELFIALTEKKIFTYQLGTSDIQHSSQAVLCTLEPSGVCLVSKNDLGA